MSDPYTVLGVARDAPKDVIKKAYRKLASSLHPDKNPGAANEKRFKEVTGAYEVLGDAKRRALYDEFGDISLQHGFDAERARAARSFGGYGGGGQAVPIDLSDIFGGGRAGGGARIGDLFGDLFGRSRGGAGVRRPARGRDVSSTIEIGFADAVLGATVNLSAPQGGETIGVRIPSGAEDGSRLRVRTKGEPGPPGGSRGDLLLTVRVRPHQHFTRQGDDLSLELPLSVQEAYHGAQVRVPTPRGEVKLTVPKGTQSGQKLRLRGKGVRREGRAAGDLYVRFLVMYPTDEAPGVRAAVDALELDGSELRRDITL